MDPVELCCAAAGLLFDAQSVIALRLLRLTDGSNAAAREAGRMMREKPIAHAEAFAAFGWAMVQGGPQSAAEASLAVYRSWVSANQRRLSHP